MGTLQKGQRCKVIKVDTGGLKLRREPNTNPLSDGTTITLESVKSQTSNGQTSYKVTYTYYKDRIKKEETGWVASDFPPDGTPLAELFEIVYMVNSEDGLNLRREPNLKDKTKEGKKNIISVLPDGTLVAQESGKVVDYDNHIWYYIWNLENMEQSGWVASELLDEIIPYSESFYREWVNRPLPPGTSASPLSAAATVRNVSYKTSQKFRVAYLQSEPADVNLGAVKYNKKGGKEKRTSVEDWNAAVGTNTKYRIKV